MRRTPVRYGGIALANVLIGVLGVSPTAASAQTRWIVPTTIGYTAGGIGVSIVSYNYAKNVAVGVIPLSLLGGLFAGLLVGATADDALDRGDTLSSAHRWAVRAGTVLTGGSVGAGAAAYLLGPREDGPVSGGGTLLAGMLGGAALGAVVQYALDDRLWPSGRLRVGVGPGAGPGGRGAQLVDRHGDHAISG
jgi:hypothetical protein